MAADMEISRLSDDFGHLPQAVDSFSPFLLEKVSANLVEYADVLHVKKQI